MNNLKEISSFLDGWIETAQQQYSLTDADIVWLLEQKAMSRYRLYVYRKTVVFCAAPEQGEAADSR